MRVAFCHPDLGLGGAERLIVDAAAELAARGHTVDVYTAYFNPQRCFQETLDGSFRVLVRGGWFPRQLFGRCTAFCAYVRCILAALSLIWAHCDVVIVDQVSIVNPVIRLFSSAKVVFYCHFPDFLLASPGSRAHRAYRRVLDRLEEATTGQADCILVNSQFTQGVFYKAFQRLKRSAVPTQVLYPAVQLQPLKGPLPAGTGSALPQQVQAFLGRSSLTFLSINRFERKKNVALAIQALARTLQLSSPPSSPRSPSRWALLGRRASQKGSKGPPPTPPCCLVVAGGYDERLLENRQVLAELQDLAKQLGVQERVMFVPSFTDEQRTELLQACRAVVYTPADEHFGIVPLEAMAAGRPVIASNSGGPLETVVHKSTGFLCQPQPEHFAQAMAALADDALAKRMGQQARAHAEANFSRAAFGTKLEAVLLGLLGKEHAAGKQSEGS